MAKNTFLLPHKLPFFCALCASVFDSLGALGVLGGKKSNSQTRPSSRHPCDPTHATLTSSRRLTTPYPAPPRPCQMAKWQIKLSFATKTPIPLCPQAPLWLNPSVNSVPRWQKIETRPSTHPSTLPPMLPCPQHRRLTTPYPAAQRPTILILVTQKIYRSIMTRYENSHLRPSPYGRFTFQNTFPLNI